MLAMMMTGPGEITACKIDRFRNSLIKLGNEIKDIMPKAIVADKKDNIIGKEKYLKRCRNRDKLYIKRIHKYGRF